MRQVNQLRLFPWTNIVAEADVFHGIFVLYMHHNVKISELISTDIRSRANANIIRSAIDGINERIILDFEGVSFISRSFTDELYNVLEEHKNISFTNTSDNIKAMLDAVEKGRKSTRNFSNSSEIKEFHDFASLSAFLATI